MSKRKIELGDDGEFLFPLDDKRRIQISPDRVMSAARTTTVAVAVMFCGVIFLLLSAFNSRPIPRASIPTPIATVAFDSAPKLSCSDLKSLPSPTDGKIVFAAGEGND